MASLADVENTIKAILVAACYPSGTGQPSALPGAVPVAIMRGWPNAEELAVDLAAGRAVVSIWPRPGERSVTRYAPEWGELTPAATTIVATVNALQTEITLSGTVSTPQNVAAIVNGASYVYGVQPGDTLSTIAAALASLIDDDTPASSSGPVVTIPSAHSLEARAGGEATLIRELSRQERQWQIICWCNTPEQRDVVAPFMDGVLKGRGLARPREFIALPDGAQARITPIGAMPNDNAEQEGLFRSDLVFMVEYPTTETTPATEVVATELIVSNL